MTKPVFRYQAQLPLRRSYKPGRRPVLRVRPQPIRADAPREPDFNAACAPEGAWAFTRTE